MPLSIWHVYLFKTHLCISWYIPWISKDMKIYSRMKVPSSIHAPGPFTWRHDIRLWHHGLDGKVLTHTHSHINILTPSHTAPILWPQPMTREINLQAVQFNIFCCCRCYTWCIHTLPFPAIPDMCGPPQHYWLSWTQAMLKFGYGPEPYNNTYVCYQQLY